MTTKVELLAKIRAAVADLRPVLKQVGIPESRFDVPEKYDNAPMTLVREAAKWLDSVEPSVQNYRKARSLLPDSMWEKYEAWGGFEETQEVKILKNETKSLTAAIKNRPTLFKKGEMKNVLREKNQKTGSKGGAIREAD